MLKYQELANELLQEIIKGSFPDGKLPSMQKLSAEYSVSLQTAQSAIKSLAKKGIVTCMPGNAGTRINRARTEMIKQSKQQTPLYDHGLSPECVTLRFVYTENLFNNIMPKIVKSFEKRYPWVKLKLIPERNLARILEEGKEVDVIMVNGRDIPYLAQRGLLQEVPGNYPYLNNVNNASYFQSRCFGLAIAWTMPVIRFRRDLTQMLDQRDMYKTIAAMTETCKAKNAAINIGFYSLMHYFLGDLSKNHVLNNNDDRMIRKTIEIFSCFCRDKSPGSYLWHNNELKESGNSVKFGYITSMTKEDDSSQDYDYVTTFSDTQAVPLTTISLGVAAKAQHPQESYLWCNFLLQEEIQQEFSNICGFLSPLQTVYRERCMEKLRSQLDSALLQAANVGMSSRGLFMFYSSIYPILEEYFEGKRHLESTVQEIRKIFNEVNYAQAYF